MTVQFHTPTGNTITIALRDATSGGQRADRGFLIDTLRQLGTCWPHTATGRRIGLLARRLKERQIRPPGGKAVPGLRPLAGDDHAP